MMQGIKPLDWYSHVMVGGYIVLHPTILTGAKDISGAIQSVYLSAYSGVSIRVFSGVSQALCRVAEFHQTDCASS